MTKLVVDLNTADLTKVVSLITATRHLNPIYKVGITFIYVHGVALLRSLGLTGAQLMLDLKGVEIPHTVSEALKGILEHVTPLVITIYPDDSGKHIEAARKVIDDAKVGTRLLQITVLTTTDSTSYLRIQRLVEGERYRVDAPLTLNQLLVGRTSMARESGAHGIVCSAKDLPMIKSGLSWLGMASACTGIRPTWATWVVEAEDDQARPATLDEVKKARPTYAIVGRPISAAPDPGQAAKRILDKFK